MGAKAIKGCDFQNGSYTNPSTLLQIQTGSIDHQYFN